MFIGSLQATAVPLLALLQLYETLRKIQKLKETLTCIHCLLIPSLTSNIFSRI